MFKWIKRLLLLIFLLAALVVGITFTTENNTLMPLVVFGYTLPELSIGLWVTIAVFAGAITGFLLSFFPTMLHRHTNKSKDKRIAQLESEVTRLRVSSIKGA